MFLRNLIFFYQNTQGFGETLFVIFLEDFGEKTEKLKNLSAHLNLTYLFS